MTPGFKTSEYWIHACYALILLVNESGFVGQPIPADKVMGIAAPIIVYIFGRNLLKAAAMFFDAKPVDASKLNQ